MTNTIKQLYDLGQSLWCDNLSRHMIDSGELKRMINDGIVGVTSNPTIFMKAITGSHDYDDLLARASAKSDDKLAVYESLVLPDIADAADVLQPTFDQTDRVDGFVSLEVNPKLAYDTEGTLEEARRLFRALDRPNVFIKVPATPQGIPAIETLIGEGINVNVTLIFGIDMYERVMRAYLDGLSTWIESGGKADCVASVASFFVSRVDTLVDKLLMERVPDESLREKLMHRAGIANAKLAYARFLEVFDRHGDFRGLATEGARVQRPLWASTSTKNPTLPDTMYVDNLVGPHTVNTLPPQTIQAVLDHGGVNVTIDQGLDEARRYFDELAAVGIAIEEVTDQLMAEGVDLFAASFDEVLANIESKSRQVRAV